MGAGLATTKCFESCRGAVSETNTEETVIPLAEKPEAAKLSSPGSATGTTATDSALFHMTHTRPKRQISNQSVTSSPVLSELGGRTPSEAGSTLSKSESHTVPSAYASSAKVLNLSPVSSDTWERIMRTLEENPVGAYLVYTPVNNGCWQCVWSRKVIPSAWAFSKPLTPTEIPNYKFNGRPENLAVGIHSSKELMCLGWVEFVKLARRHNGSLVMLPAIEKEENREISQSLVVTLHDAHTQLVHHVRPGDPPISNLQDYDAVGVVTGQRGPAAIADMIGPKVSPTILATVASRYGQGLVFLEGL